MMNIQLTNRIKVISALSNVQIGHESCISKPCYFRAIFGDITFISCICLITSRARNDSRTRDPKIPLSTLFQSQDRIMGKKGLGWEGAQIHFTGNLRIPKIPPCCPSVPIMLLFHRSSWLQSQLNWPKPS